MQKWVKTIFLGVLLTVALSAPLSAQTGEQHWMRFSLRGGGDFRLYSPVQSVSATGFTFDAGAQLMLQVVPWLGVQAEALFTMDFPPILETRDSKLHAATGLITASSLMFPVIFMITSRPADWLIAPLGGFYINMPLGPMKTPAGDSAYQWRYSRNRLAFGWTLGIEVGRKVGPGTLFTDIRFMGDFGDMTAENGKFKARRTGVSLSLGYGWPILPKKPKAPKEAAAE